MSQTYTLTLDKKKLQAEAQKYIDMSPVFKEWEDVKKLKWPEALQPPQLWTTMKELQELIGATCAAVELAKQKFLKEADPDGTKGAKVDGATALSIAADIVFGALQFTGIYGKIISYLWKPILNVIISIYVNQQPVGWASIATSLLKIVL
jgi:hypothetical protein